MSKTKPPIPEQCRTERLIAFRVTEADYQAIQRAWEAQRAANPGQGQRGHYLRKVLLVGLGITPTAVGYHGARKLGLL